MAVSSCDGWKEPPSSEVVCLYIAAAGGEQQWGAAARDASWEHQVAPPALSLFPAGTNHPTLGLID